MNYLPELQKQYEVMRLDISQRLYNSMKSHDCTTFTEPSPREMQLLEAQRLTILDMQTTYNAKRFRAGDKYSYQKRKVPKSAKHKMRNYPAKKGYRMYMWIAEGSANDYLCSRYVDTKWSAAHDMPVPGTRTDMNDSHINCMCRMEFIGMADEFGEPIQDPFYDSEWIYASAVEPVAP